MLIDTPIKTGDVISFKLVSGEELVAKFEEQTDTILKVRNPLGLQMTGAGSWGLAPYMATVDPKTSFTFRREAVVCIMKTVDDTAKSYIEATSGIQFGVEADA
jgi:hypothetical protein